MLGLADSKQIALNSSWSFVARVMSSGIFPFHVTKPFNIVSLSGNNLLVDQRPCLLHHAETISERPSL